MAKDIYHDAAKEALTKDGWLVTHDPYDLEIENFSTLHIDLGAEKMIAAEKGTQKIAVEIKSFIGLSQITNFYAALGKFNFYEVMLREVEADRTLFLAIPLRAYRTFFQKDAVQKVIKEFDVHIFVYDQYKAEIVEWIK
ncbi:MAG: element excision factor XisH family protein [Bacteroidota bacterium]